MKINFWENNNVEKTHDGIHFMHSRTPETHPDLKKQDIDIPGNNVIPMIYTDMQIPWNIYR